jgi:excisionase family DNA binding protein
MSTTQTDTQLEDALTVLKVSDLAQRLQVNPITIRRWIHSGRLPAQKLGKSYRVKASDVIRLLSPTQETTA